jgi:benzoyl-CoA reductase/2-hydroxyglutaryl-CoA dehydratase subunit BcrC/BadD/HgdB
VNGSEVAKIESATMVDETRRSRLEIQILNELEEIGVKIQSLEDERKSLLRLLASARSKDKVARSVKRKNSLDRTVVEACIHEALSEGKPLKSSDLRKRVASVVFSMNDNTFRSYLHRMKEKGLITHHKGKRGVWTLPNTNLPN